MRGIAWLGELRFEHVCLVVVRELQVRTSLYGLWCGARARDNQEFEVGTSLNWSIPPSHSTPILASAIIIILKISKSPFESSAVVFTFFPSTTISHSAFNSSV